MQWYLDSHGMCKLDGNDEYKIETQSSFHHILGVIMDAKFNM